MLAVTRVAVAAIALVMIGNVGFNLLGSSPAPGSVRSPVDTPSPAAKTTRITVAGSEVTGRMDLTVDLPEGWDPRPWGAAAPEVPGSDDWTLFVVSLVDNTFADPCTHTQRKPKVGSTVEDAAAALGQIPGTTATAPTQTTVAGHEATYIEITLPGSLPCPDDQFYLWQDSPNGDWWATDPAEVIRVWLLDVEGRPVAIAARTYPGTTEELKDTLKSVLDTIVFEVPSSQPSPAASAS